MDYFIDIWIKEFIACVAITTIVLRLKFPLILRFRRSNSTNVKKWKWAINIAGFLTPWITALVVWVILQIQGKPVVKLSDAISGHHFMYLLATIVFITPFLVFASLAKYVLKRGLCADTERKMFEKKLIVLNGLIGGIIFLGSMAYGLWQDFYEAFESIILGFPYIISINIAGIIVGLFAGWVTLLAEGILWTDIQRT